MVSDLLGGLVYILQALAHSDPGLKEHALTLLVAISADGKHTHRYTRTRACTDFTRPRCSNT